MKLPIQIKKTIAFPGVFLPYYASKPIIKFVYRKSAARLQTASRKNLLRNRLIYSLENSYKTEICDLKKNIDQECQTLPHEHSGIIWICWFQGIENAPDIVKLCYNSVCKNLGGQYKIVLLTEENWRDYVSMPDDIVNMRDKGIISNAHFSDMLRLNLLINHGGTWLDATVLCTEQNPPEYMLQSDLFMIQTMIPDRGTFATQIENYFISASQNNKILMLALQLTYLYWRRYNFLLDYHISYDLLQIAIEQYPEEWDKIIPFPRARIETMESSWDNPYDDKLYSALLAQSPFHKLSHKCKVLCGSIAERLVKSVKKAGEE